MSDLKKDLKGLLETRVRYPDSIAIEAAKTRQALRDQFACAALTGLLSGLDSLEGLSLTMQNALAGEAYSLADGMLKVREEKDD